MMKKIILLGAAATGFSLLAKPAVEWNFENAIPDKGVVLSNDKKFRLGDGYG